MTLADLDRDCAEATRVLLDSSSLIAYHRPHERAYPIANHLLRRISSPSDPLLGYCSMISASELLIRPMRAGKERADFMHDFLTTYPGLTLLQVDLMVALQAATLRAVTNIRFPDAMIVASGILARCEVVFSNDERWKQQLAPPYPQFRWLYLNDYPLSDIPLEV